MTSPSDNKGLSDVEQKVNAALDHSVANLPQQTKDDIFKVRQAALYAAKQQMDKTSLATRIGKIIRHPMPTVAVPVAAAVLIALSLEYGSVEPVPALPVAMMTEDVPTEDLSLLEDLELVTWLAENEQAALL